MKLRFYLENLYEIEPKICPLHYFQAKNVPSALFLGVTGRKNGLYQTSVQYAQ